MIFRDGTDAPGLFGLVVNAFAWNSRVVGLIPADTKLCEGAGHDSDVHNKMTQKIRFLFNNSHKIMRDRI